MSDFKKPKFNKNPGGRPSGNSNGKPSQSSGATRPPRKDYGNAIEAPQRGAAPTRGDVPLPPKRSGQAWLHVNISQIIANYNALNEMCSRPGKPVNIAACVKADAYGLGLGPVAKALYGAGCRTFFVAHASEGRLLREIVGQMPSIFVFNGPSEAEIPIFFTSKLKPVLNTLSQARMWARAVPKHEYQPRTAIHIDTGMNRLGFEGRDFDRLWGDKDLVKSLDIEVVMSHLACADTPDHRMNPKQLATFKSAAAQLPPVALSLANSAGIYLGKDYHFNMVRPGAALYGLNITTLPELHKPVVTVTAPVVQKGFIEKGDSAGYRASFTAKRDTRTITVGIGYADGIPVAASNIGHAKLNGQSLKIIGRVSMDLTILDATDYKGDIAIGDRVMFWGDDLTAQSERLGLLDYELLTRLGSRLRRDYHKGKMRL